MVGLNVKEVTAYFVWLNIDPFLRKSIVIVIIVYLIGLKIPQRTAHALRSTKVNSVNSVPAGTHESLLMEDHTSRLYHANVMEARTSVILKLESAWIINAPLQIRTLTAGFGNITLSDCSSHVALSSVSVSFVPSCFDTKASDKVWFVAVSCIVFQDSGQLGESSQRKQCSFLRVRMVSLKKQQIIGPSVFSLGEVWKPARRT